MRKFYNPFFFILFLATRFCLPNSSYAQTTSANLDTAYYFTFGSTKTEEFRDLTLTSDSGFVLVGTTNGYGPGNSSIYVVRTTKRGQHVWSIVLGGSNLDRGSSVVSLTDGGFLIAGSSNSGGAGGYDGYLAKINSGGLLLWEKYIGGSDWDFFNKMTLLPDSSILICGESYSYASGGSDAWVICLDPTGSTKWQHNFGSFGNDAFHGLTILNDAIYLGGEYQGLNLDGYLVKLNFSGSLIFETQLQLYGNDKINSITSTPSSTLVIAGGSIYVDSIKSELWVQEVDTNGNAGWLVSGGSDAVDDYMNSVVVKSNGDVISAGLQSPGGLGIKGMLSLQLDANGSNFRAQTFGGSVEQEIYSSVLTPDGGIAYAGYTNSFGNGNKDACLLLLGKSEMATQFDYVPVSNLETLSPIGIPENNFINTSILLYPNPASERVHFQIHEDFDLNKVEIISVDGKKCLEDIFHNPIKQSIDISSLETGIYFLILENKNGIKFTGRFTKM